MEHLNKAGYRAALIGDKKDIEEAENFNELAGSKADIDFLLRVDKATSILEGKYDTIGKTSGISNLKDMYEREVANEQSRSDKDFDVFSS